MTLVEQQARYAGVVQRAGGGATLTLRARHTLTGNSGPVASLSAFGAHAPGASTLTLDANGGRLNGMIYGATAPSTGSQITFAGHAAPYTIQATATAAGGSSDGTGNRLTVTISPALSANVADNATATISRGYAEFVFTYSRTAAAAEGDIDLNVEARLRRYALPALSAPVTPKSGMLCIVGSETEYVHEVHPRGTLADAGWVISVGAQAAA